MTDTCATCKFLVRDEGSLTCHRFPPQVTEITHTPFITGEGREMRLGLSQAWPAVGDENWCGEFQSAEPFQSIRSRSGPMVLDENGELISYEEYISRVAKEVF